MKRLTGYVPMSRSHPQMFRNITWTSTDPSIDVAESNCDLEMLNEQKGAEGLTLNALMRCGPFGDLKRIKEG